MSVGALFSGNRFRGPFIPLGPDESPQAFAARMREREQRVPFRRWRPVWQVQVLPRAQPSPDDEPGTIIELAGYSSLMRRAAAVAEGRRVAAIPNRWVRAVDVVDIGTGEVAFTNG